MANLNVQIYKCTTLNVRSGAGTGYKIVAVVKNGEKHTSSKQKNGWYYLDKEKGWVSGSYVKKLSENKSPNKPPAKKTEPNKKPPTVVEPTYGSDFRLDKTVVDKIMKKSKENSNRINASMRMFGTPFQFLPSVDTRVDENNMIGRKYMETILGEGCVVSISPGRPLFLPDLTSEESKGFAAYMKGLDKSNASKDSESLLNAVLGGKDTRYFDFVSDYASYIKYVNLLCRATAVYMGIGDKPVLWESKKYSPDYALRYKAYDWTRYRFEDISEDYKKAKKEKNKTGIFGGILKDMISTAQDTWEDLSKAVGESIYEALFGNFQYVHFYVDPNSSFNETNSNNTQKSAIEGFIDKGQDLSKEFAFFIGATDSDILASSQASLGTYLSELGSSIDNNGSASFISRLLGTAGAVTAGSNMIFPEIWTDSSYQKSYTISVNLFSPYGDKESIFLNVMVPLMHLLALASPKQTSANSFAAPFLVRVASKGWFSCDMGMVDNISIEKVEGSWTVDGLPSEVRVQLSIKDLYPSLMITPSDRPKLFFNNNALMQYLTVNAGLDVTSSTMMIRFKSFGYLLFNMVLDLPTNYYARAKENIANLVKQKLPFAGF